MFTFFVRFPRVTALAAPFDIADRGEPDERKSSSGIQGLAVR